MARLLWDLLCPSLHFTRRPERTKHVTDAQVRRGQQHLVGGQYPPLHPRWGRSSLTTTGCWDSSAPGRQRVIILPRRTCSLTGPAWCVGRLTHSVTRQQRWHCWLMHRYVLHRWNWSVHSFAFVMKWQVAHMYTMFCFRSWVLGPADVQFKGAAKRLLPWFVSLYHWTVSQSMAKRGNDHLKALNKGIILLTNIAITVHPLYK